MGSPPRSPLVHISAIVSTSARLDAARTGTQDYRQQAKSNARFVTTWPLRLNEVSRYVSYRVSVNSGRLPWLDMNAQTLQ